MSDPFLAGDFFHIYSRTNGEELLFRNEENYNYFLKKYQDHCSGYFSTLSYCLLPNHFHFMIQVKEDTKPEAALGSFSNFLNSYAKSYNKLYDRHGGLFQRKFKRKRVGQESYLSQVIIYIHKNPQKHGIVKDFKSWKFSSFNALISQKPTNIERDFVLDWFGGLEEFKKVHELEQVLDLIEDLSLE
ncbi:REP element-mobilizing transposase RayT [Algoriphagus ornithinivorans]|uniref:REP element-mobilizing transposase RayT n=1 Tax=Algoriphagus ornithinivorans TaxID=226506 RepID=A0A1I5JCC2_9BACT|nr:transposase [Algoriphagus ornithinivorans]SFO70392.1 REP element-mobilizing transposase RayT [Algoriphagus ornithinivorans]